MHPDPDHYYHTRFFQSVIWTDVLEETIGPDKFSSALPTGPMVFDNSAVAKICSWLEYVQQTAYVAYLLYVKFLCKTSNVA